MVNSSENSSAVTSIDTHDMCGSGKDDLLVGRRDGTVQVFSLPLADSEIDTEVREIFCDVATLVQRYLPGSEIKLFHFL